MHWEARFLHTAGAQDGVIGLDQLPSMGCDSRHWGRARRNGRWERLSRRVLRLEGTTPSQAARAHAGVLDAGGEAALHGPSTLAWLGFRAYDLSTVHVTRQRGTTNGGCELAVVHRLRDLEPSEISVVRGVPTVSALRAIWSEASRYANDRWHEVGLLRIGRLLDDANRMGLLPWAVLHASIDSLRRSGRAGTRLMRELAEQRHPGTSATESRNEDQFEAVLDRFGITPMERQPVVGRTAPIGRADFRDADLPLVVEINSVTFHSLPSDQHADEERYDEFVAAGFAVAVVWENDLWSRQRNVVDTVLEARRLARRGEPAVVHSAGCPWPPEPTRLVIGTYVPPARG